MENPDPSMAIIASPASREERAIGAYRTGGAVPSQVASAEEVKSRNDSSLSVRASPSRILVASWREKEREFLSLGKHPAPICLRTAPPSPSEGHCDPAIHHVVGCGGNPGNVRKSHQHGVDRVETLGHGSLLLLQQGLRSVPSPPRLSALKPSARLPVDGMLGVPARGGAPAKSMDIFERRSTIPFSF